MATTRLVLLFASCSAAVDHTYKACEVPEFEWAVYGTYTTGRMYGMASAIAGDYIFAGGFLKSTLNPEADGFVESTADYGITGPFTTIDPDGTNATTVEVDLESYPTSGGAKENAGGSWRAYEVGVAKIDITTGEPVDVFVYGGDGMDEASGMAASGNVLAVSGHFTGNLSAEMTDGTKKTIRNSNVPPGDLPALADQFHPNVRDASAHTGVDDGFVIKADASTGKAHWIVHYPQSNSDAQIVGVDVDASGNVYGSGYECAVAAGETAKMCHGIVAKFAAADGAVAWERKFSDLGAALWLKHDASDDSIYFTATTTYGGSANGKAHANCEHASCAVTARLSASDGTTDWIRTFQASPRWGVFDQSGDIELAAPADGPYLYAAFDDAAEIGAVTLDAGTPYAGCKAADGAVTPEYEMDISTSKRITADDCPPGSTFVAQTDADAVPAAAAKTYVLCGDKTDGDACIVKYHKYTGLPVWSKDLPMVAGLAVMPDGKSIMATGWYYYSWPESGRTFGDRVLPGYLRAGGLGSQRWEARCLPR